MACDVNCTNGERMPNRVRSDAENLGPSTRGSSAAQTTHFAQDDMYEISGATDEKWPRGRWVMVRYRLCDHRRFGLQYLRRSFGS